jgi:hypothetical protein
VISSTSGRVVVSMSVEVFKPLTASTGDPAPKLSSFL